MAHGPRHWQVNITSRTTEMHLPGSCYDRLPKFCLGTRLVLGNRVELMFWFRLFQLEFLYQFLQGCTHTQCCKPNVTTEMYWVGQKVRLGFCKMLLENLNELFGQPNLSLFVYLIKKFFL